MERIYANIFSVVSCNNELSGLKTVRKNVSCFNSLKIITLIGVHTDKVVSPDIPSVHVNPI